MNTIYSLIDQGIWKLVAQPSGRKIVTRKWIGDIKIKQTTAGTIGTRYEERVVARGYTHVEGVYFLNTYAPIVKFISDRTLLSLVAQMDPKLHQIDIITAFLDGELSKQVYMEKTFDYVRGDRQSQVCF